jgi:hypothetical protein
LHCLQGGENSHKYIGMTLTLDQYQERLRELAGEAAKEAREAAVVINANRLKAEIQNRISRQGLDSSGKKMKDYSTSPWYYKKDKFVKKGAFKAKGKNGESKFKNGNTKKTMYMQHGYKEFREVQGRQTGHRDLTLSGETFRTFQTGQSGDAVLIGFTTQQSKDIRMGNEDRNGGKIYTATEDEIKDYHKNLMETELELIKRVFQ